MKKDFGNFLIIISVSLASIFAITLLLKRYYFLTFEHFTKVCSEGVSTFFSSGTHDIGLVLTVIAVLGTFVFFLKSLLSFIKTQMEIDEILKRKINASVNISDSRLTVVHLNTDLAITIGWIHPKIIISDKLIAKLSKKELEAVILHETYHLKRRHPLLLVIAEIVSSSLFFIPIIKDLTWNLKVILEREADIFTAKKQKGNYYLNLALEKVTAQDKFNLFPTFSKRNNLSIRKSSIMISAIAAFVFISLFLLPVQAHANSKMLVSTSKCASNQCSVNCP